MKISNNFEVSLPADQAWATLMDIERIVVLVPGAELTEAVDADTFKGKVSVKLGPIALNFAGTVKFVERDEASHCASVVAKGNETKGRGGANADISFSLKEISPGLTRVSIDTDLNLSGSVTQYGRGGALIQEVSQQIIDRFAANLKASLGTETGSESFAKVEAQAGAPISGFALFAAALHSWVRGLFGRGQG